MAGNENNPRSQKYVVHGDGNITAGVFTDSQVINQSGEGNRAANSLVRGNDALGPWLERLSGELTEMRSRLENIRDPRFSADREDALDAVTVMEADLPGLSASGPDAPRKIRRRVRELLGVLAPVAEIIGGVAALEQILPHL